MQKNGVTVEENAPPGTVVDTFIVHPTENDFYLLSHQGIKVKTKSFDLCYTASALSFLTFLHLNSFRDLPPVQRIIIRCGMYITPIDHRKFQ